MNPKINKWLDLLDRAGWTAVQAAFGALIVYLTMDVDMSWENVLVGVGSATLLAVAKVVVGQNSGGDNTGSLIGTPVIEPPPEDK